MPAQRKSKVVGSAPRFRRGETVEVHEPGIRPWRGTVNAVKWSPASGWWCEVAREGVGTWVIKESDLHKTEKREVSV